MDLTSFHSNISWCFPHLMGQENDQIFARKQQESGKKINYFFGYFELSWATAAPEQLRKKIRPQRVFRTGGRIECEVEKLLRRDTAGAARFLFYVGG